MKKYSIADLFCGTGGFSIGLESSSTKQVAFKTIYANDFAPESKQIHDENFSFELDLCDINTKNINFVYKLSFYFIMIQLITNYYVDKSLERQGEIDYTLNENIKNTHIDKIVIIVDDALKYTHLKEKSNKISLHLIPTRPTFKNYFEVANYHIEFFNQITVIANSDIIFNDSLKNAFMIGENDVYAITRDDEINRWTQDAWIFRGLIKCPEESSFYLGTRGCDGSIAYLLHKEKYNVSNPARSINLQHIHKSNVRTWKQDKRHAPFPWMHMSVCNVGENSHTSIINDMPEHISFSMIHQRENKNFSSSQNFNEAKTGNTGFGIGAPNRKVSTAGRLKRR